MNGHKYMTKEIENTIKKIACADITIALYDAQKEGFIIPDKVFEIVKKVKDGYGDESLNPKKSHGN